MPTNIKTGNSIKVDTRFKGIHHYEDYLIKKHHRELVHFIFERNYSLKTKNRILRLYPKIVKRENIKQIYTHTIMEFLLAIVRNDLEKLYAYTSCTNIKN